MSAVMSQLSVTTKVVWLLDLTSQMCCNSGVMNMAQEADIIHFRPSSKKSVALPDICQVLTKSLFKPKVSIIVKTQWLMNRESCWKIIWKSRRSAAWRHYSQEVRLVDMETVHEYKHQFVCEDRNKVFKYFKKRKAFLLAGFKHLRYAYLLTVVIWSCWIFEQI